MQIKNKLALYFTLLSAVLSFIVLFAVNLLYSKHTEDDFFTALKERAIVTAQVYLEADEISDSSLQHFKKEYLNTLHNEVIKMYDSNGNAEFINERNKDWPQSTIRSILKNKYLQYTSNDTAVVGIRYDDNQGSFAIIASAQDKAGNELRYNLLKITLILYFLQLVLLFLAGRWFAKKTLEPVQKINKQVQMINATDLHLRVDEGNGKDEISGLGINFNALLQRLETTFEIQKTFVANASHELRTPLTSIIGEIEVAVLSDRKKEEYQQVLNSVLVEAEKLNNVIAGLLQLANTEKIIALQSVQQVRLDDLLWEIQEVCKKNNPPLILNIKMASLPTDENKLCITANKHLLYTAIINVIRNAFKFSNNKPVNCILSHTTAGLEISIRDEGIGISKEDLQKIFSPFYRSPSVSKFDGQGLGLFITKKVIELYKGSISFNSEINAGTTVNITFS